MRRNNVLRTVIAIRLSGEAISQRGAVTNKWDCFVPRNDDKKVSSDY